MPVITCAPLTPAQLAAACALNIAAPEGYSPALKAALGQRLGASEVCCIFGKAVRAAPVASAS